MTRRSTLWSLGAASVILFGVACCFVATRVDKGVDDVGAIAQNLERSLVQGMSPDAACVVLKGMGAEAQAFLDEKGMMSSIFRNRGGGLFLKRSILVETYFDNNKLVRFSCREVFTGP